MLPDLFAILSFKSTTMAAEMVSGAFLSASVELLFKQMASKEAIDFVRGKKLNEKLLNKLKIMLLSANRVLNDAEKKQFIDPVVRQWLHQLKDAIYDAEDLVYEINTEALRCELELGQSGSGALFRVRNFFSSRFTVRKIEQRLEDILSLLQFIVEQKDVLGLREAELETRPFPRLSAAATLVEEFGIYGRDADKEAIIKLLCDEVGGGDHKVSVIPIVGMGGIGKTALAQFIYRDIDCSVMNKPFDVKAWITVSEESDVFALTKTIFEEVTHSPNCCTKELVQLQLQLKEFLKDKKFLFVLDDVWNLNYRRWYDLKSPFDYAAHGSKIIVTTRSTEIASMMGSVPHHELQILSDGDCWKLFTKHAFENIEPSAHSGLEVIGRQIIKKCQGLPLAIKSLGGLLRFKLNPKEWENILKSDLWELLERECDILPALWLSYYYLPSHLKRCFAYCSIFPKDYKIEKQTLILLWMAEDLLQPEKNKALEEVGEEYIKDLTSRSFFQCGNQCGRFTMHDLVNDLAKFVSGECCLRLDDNYSEGFLMKTRHLSCMAGKVHDIKIIEGLFKNKVLRSLVVLGASYTSKEHVHYLIHPEELQSMRYLRVLFAFNKLFTCEEAVITKLLDSIGDLKLLRYLDLSNNTRIKEVPDTICTLYNLQTLLFTHCRQLVVLPDSIGNLKHLRYLDLSETRIRKVPDTVCNLHELRTLLFSYCCELIALPDSIDNLKHLRYLDLSGTRIEKVPDTVCTLHELHTLLLRSCENLTHLPTNITSLINLSLLDISGTTLREMPPLILNLKTLLILDVFVLGKHNGSSIKELGKFQCQSGYLRIRGLENVENVEDVLEANLKGKECIFELKLEWNGNIDDSHKTREILNRLRPSTNLQSLSIENYGGTNFPDWVGHHSFSHITCVNFSGFKSCYCLPPLGQLPSLKSFHVSGFDMVERIGEEFYSNGSFSAAAVTKPFKCLERICFSDMPLWKEWWVMGGSDEEGGVFSKVKELSLSDCEMINGACLPDYLPSLKRLVISGRNQLLGSLSWCEYPSLASLKIFGCGEVELFPQGTLPSIIRNIEIENCRKLVSLSEEGWPSNLKSLSIMNCGKLFTSSTSKRKQWNLQSVTSLSSLVISNIDDEVVDPFPEEGQLPTTLTSLKLEYIGNLKSLNGKAFQYLTSLEHLSISSCDLFQAFPEQGLPITLTYLVLSSLPNLKSLNSNAFRCLTSLKKMVIAGCNQLQCLPESGLPTTLTSFWLYNLENLKSLNGEAFSNLTSLKELLIDGCEQLQYLPKERLSESLSRLYINDCPLLKPRCKRGTGEDWHKIAHIPYIQIDDLII